jgi:hypothetical protein
MDNQEEEQAINEENIVSPFNNLAMMQQSQQNHKDQMDHQQLMEENRRTHERDMEIRRVKLDMIKIASDILTENARSKPVAEREVSAENIKTFAEQLIQYVDQE